MGVNKTIHMSYIVYIHFYFKTYITNNIICICGVNKTIRIMSNIVYIYFISTRILIIILNIIKTTNIPSLPCESMTTRIINGHV